MYLDLFCETNQVFSSVIIREEMMYLDYYRFRIGEFLKPKQSSDPLDKKTGYGWGWLFLLSYIGWGVEKAKGNSPSIFFAELICFPFILIIYFRLRKRWIEKRTYGNSIWMASFIAGLIAIFIGAGLIFLISRFVPSE